MSIRYVVVVVWAKPDFHSIKTGPKKCPRVCGGVMVVVVDELLHKQYIFVSRNACHAQ